MNTSCNVLNGTKGSVEEAETKLDTMLGSKSFLEIPAEVVKIIAQYLDCSVIYNHRYAKIYKSPSHNTYTFESKSNSYVAKSAHSGSLIVFNQWFFFFFV